jgi:hypothetical protein
MCDGERSDGQGEGEEMSGGERVDEPVAAQQMASSSDLTRGDKTRDSLAVWAVVTCARSVHPVGCPLISRSPPAPVATLWCVPWAL